MRLAPSLKLADGRMAPQLGLGVWRVPDEQVVAIVKEATAIGYRSIDTAAVYKNERGVGEAIRSCGVPRNELFITTKVWNDAHGVMAAQRAVEASLRASGLGYFDMVLVHWPVPAAGAFMDAYRGLMAARESGLCRSIGVSNFEVAHLEALMQATGEIPAVNQIELHPMFSQPTLRAFHVRHAIVTESWSPLAQGQLLPHPSLQVVARKHHKSPAQVILRWHIELGLMVIPKSSSAARLRENFTIFDFALDAEDIKVLTALDMNKRIGPVPATFGT